VRKRRSVLVVDDNGDLRDNLADILEENGFEVGTAATGEEAVEKVRLRKPDFVLMDIKMPVMSGVEAFRKIKGLSPSTVVIMMTAFTRDELVRDALREGAYAVLYKPLDVKALLDTLRRSRESGSLVMVVDDDPDLAGNLSDILNENGFRVSLASSGKEALERARQNDVDVYLIDVKMPVMNGLDTYLAIKDIRPKARALLITGYRQEASDLVEQALSGNAMACLSKPLDVGLLLQMLREITSRQRAG